MISVFYGDLYDECLRAETLKDAFDAIPAGSWRDTQQTSDGQIFSLLEYYQLLGDEEQSPDKLQSETAPNHWVYQSLHTLTRPEMQHGSGLAWRLAHANSALANKNKVGGVSAILECNNHPEKCYPYYDARIAASIAQLPAPGGVPGKHLQLNNGPATLSARMAADGLNAFFNSGEVNGAGHFVALRHFFNGIFNSGPIVTLRRFSNGITNGLYFARLERPAPEASPEEMAAAIARWWPQPDPGANWVKIVQKKKFEQFLSVLLARTRSTAGVRSARIWINGLIGWERLAVIVLAIYFAFLLIQRGAVRKKHESAKRTISNRLPILANTGKQWKTLDERFADSEKLLHDVARYSGTVPYRIVSAANEQMQARLQTAAEGGTPQPAGDYVGVRAAQERQELDSSRTMFDVLLPTFPAIGFIGTVSSLLVAMSQADRIVSTTDAFAKGLAASQVTDILSLCFSTTLLALCAVLLFSPLSVLQQSREHNLVDDIHRLVEVALRPGQ